MEGENKGLLKDQQFLLGLFAGIAVIAVIGMIIMAIVMVKGQNVNSAKTDVLTDQTAQTTQPVGSAPESIKPTAAGISTFLEKKDAVVCKEGGKPVVYLFSTTWCPHCEWVKPTFDKVVADAVKAGKIKAYHWEVDTGDNTLTTAVETEVPAEALAVYQEFNPEGSIPTFVMGCKYFRVGNGYEAQNDLTKEAAELNAAIDALK
ncbi:MAG: thioredoxin family protein [Patescibacteria group bacterium]|jgi:thiol-disulfide isomerase/thioredoxin